MDTGAFRVLVPPPLPKITKKGWEGVTFPALSLSSIPVFAPEENTFRVPIP